MWSWYDRWGQGNKRETIQNAKSLSGIVTRQTVISCLWFSSSKTAEMLTSRWYSISINLQKSSSLDVGGSGGTVNGTPSHVSDSPHATFPLYTWLITTSSTWLRKPLFGKYVTTWKKCIGNIKLPCLQLAYCTLYGIWKYEECKTIILPIVLYGCETWSLTLREEHRLRVLRRVFGPKRDEVTGEWRKLHNEELSDMYSLPNILWLVKSKRMRWAGHVARMG